MCKVKTDRDKMGKLYKQACFSSNTGVYTGEHSVLYLLHQNITPKGFNKNSNKHLRWIVVSIANTRMFQ